MRALDSYFAEYEEHHRAPLNKATHAVGIPLIALALLGLGAKLTLFSPPVGPPIDLGMALAIVLVLVYLALHAGLALGVAILLVPLYLLGREVPTAWLWAILAVGVALQYVGHFVFEGRSPAFHRNAVHMLVGPIWTASLLFRGLGLYRPGGAAEPGDAGPGRGPTS